MADDDELLIHIDKAFWPKGVVRVLTPLLRDLGDKHGNLAIAPQALKGVILVKGAADRIEEAKPSLRELIEEYFPDAPVPEELVEAGESGACEACEAEEQEAPEEPPPPPEPKATAPAPKATAPAPAPKAKAPATPATPATPAVPVCGWKRPRPVAMASPDLLWECVRNTSSFIRRPTRDLTRIFSAEPANLMGLHSSKFSGLVSNAALDVRPVKRGDKESIHIIKGHSKASRSLRPRSRAVARGLSKCPRKGFPEIDREVNAKFYRRELHGLARLKYLKVQRSFKKGKATVKSRRAPKA
mmetsp:Transcript_35366/g.75332  ORF Transcript_35366/g.75332 Transcript_35366/m.75332 type:complete len:300 (-) Transcript_35366:218-1117(-)